MHVLVATDAQWVVDEIVAALSGPETSFTVCRNGRDVTDVVMARTPDIAILDLQSGSMGGMAVAMNLRHDESSGAMPRVPILMVLDRQADVFLARRSGADSWIVKPLDALSIKRGVACALTPALDDTDDETDDAPAETVEEEQVTAG
ncbi:MAG: response regulator [Actinobacteria bacterium]|nr:response regulator [Actinomycetota bacterium]